MSLARFQKLTPAQATLLRKLPCPVVERYKPAPALVEKGLAFWSTEGKMGNRTLSPTDRGAEWVKHNQPEARP